MTTTELDEIMEALGELWKLPLFERAGLDLWRTQLLPLDFAACSTALGKLAASGRHPRFRPDLPVVLEAVAAERRANASRAPDSPVLPPAPKDRALAGLAAARAQLPPTAKAPRR